MAGVSCSISLPLYVWLCVCLLPPALLQSDSDSVVCPDDQEFNQCGSACTPTCDDPSPICTEECVARCECVADKPLLFRNTCIRETACPPIGIGNCTTLSPNLPSNGTESDLDTEPLCYYFVNVSHNFNDSRQICKSLDAELYIPRTEEEQAELVSYMRSAEFPWTNRTWFIGGMAPSFGQWLSTIGATEGVYRAEQNLFNWKEGGERNASYPERCVAYNDTSKYWEAHQCQIKLPHVICFKSVYYSRDHHLCQDPAFFVWSELSPMCKVARWYSAPDGLSWYGAHDFCLKLNMTLFCPLLPADNNVLSQLWEYFNINDTSIAWIGVHSSFFTFLDGSRILNDALLDATERTENYDDKHCLVIDLDLENSVWKLVQCKTMYPAVCAKYPDDAFTSRGFYQGLIDSDVYIVTQMPDTLPPRITGTLTTFDWRFLFTTPPDGAAFSRGHNKDRNVNIYVPALIMCSYTFMFS